MATILLYDLNNLEGDLVNQTYATSGYESAICGKTVYNWALDLPMELLRKVWNEVTEWTHT